jgi:hypothetical protein
VGAAR